MNEYKIHVGGEVRIANGLFAAKYIIYAGMPTADTFSIAYRGSGTEWSWAYNLYYPASTAVLVLGEKKITVIEVNPQLLWVRIERESW